MVGRSAEIPGFALASDAWSDRLWRDTFHARYGAVVLLACIAALATELGGYRFVVAGALLAFGLPYNFLLHQVQRRTGSPPALLPYTDTAACLIFALIEPATFIPTLMVMLAAVALATVIFGRANAMGAVIMATAGLTGVTLVIEPPFGAIGVLGFVVAAGLVIVTVTEVADNERRLRQRMSSVVDGLDAVVWEASPPLARFDYVSGRAEELLGHPGEAWLTPAFWFANVHPEDRDRVAEERLDAIAGRGGHTAEYRMVRADGGVVHVHELVSFTRDHSGRVLGAQGVMIDVSVRNRTQERVVQYADLVERIKIGLLILRLDDAHDDNSLLLVAANPSAAEALQRPLQTRLGKRFDRLFPALLNTALPRRLAEVVRSGVPFDIAHFPLREGQPDEKIFYLRAFPLAGQAVGLSFEDITGQTMAAAALRRQALHDGLTGLPNRAMFSAALATALREAKELGGAVALLTMDLDQFKEVNDALGHHHGDLLLQSLADRLGERFPDVELIARLGGDEFAMLLADTSLAEAEATAVAIGEALQEPFLLEQLRIQTNASVGIAVYPDHAEDAESLAQRADVAMYQAKRSTASYSVYAADLDRSSIRRLTLMSEFRRALELNEFVLHYQPMISIATGKVVRVEALVRWAHPSYGLMPPDEFIELAELSGFIQPLTRWVLAQGIRTMASWHRGGHDIGLAVNLSVRNLYDPSLPGHLEELLTKHGIRAADLTLEVTESELMDDPSLALQVLTQLDGLGIATSVDDFGTGYSSLTYLKDLPIKEIKIDRSFVSGMRSRGDDLTIVRSTIDLGHNLGLEVVAEGVEDPAIMARLVELGCDLAQGYLLSRPLSAEDLRHWLMRQGWPQLPGNGQHIRRPAITIAPTLVRPPPAIGPGPTIVRPPPPPGADATAPMRRRPPVSDTA
jgi:diguanylate cyclase (GGDEF)-like protein/PAS domain S-box-containing protein